MSLNEAISLPSLRQKLEEGGFQTMEQLLASSVKEMAAELDLNFEEVKQLIDVCDKERGIRKRTFQELIEVEIQNSISTNSKNIDKLFEHGIPPRKITEICGESGSGKTQLCTQLAINVQLLRNKGGIDGECIYIDTEGSFLTSRFIELANRYNVDRLLRGLHYFRVLDHTEFMGLIRQLPEIVKSYPKVKLIIIDSIAYHFRLNVLDARARTAILYFLGRTLTDIARANDLSVVVSNHVTQEGSEAAWTPSLGTGWGTWCANRLFIFRKRHFRYAYLYKSFDTRSTPIQFCIKAEGILDPEEDEIEVKKLESETQSEINTQIDTSWAHLKEKHLDEKEQEKVDGFWKDACLADEFLSQLPPQMEVVAKEEETVPTNNGLNDDTLYPNVEEEQDIPCTQVELTEDPGLFESHILNGSSSILSSEEDTTIESITPTNSITDHHVPQISSSEDIDISNVPPDLSSSLPKKRRKRTYENSQSSNSNITIPDNNESMSNNSHLLKRLKSSNSMHNDIVEEEPKASTTATNVNNNKNKSIILDDDWNSEEEEELDYAFLEEINSSL